MQAQFAVFFYAYGVYLHWGYESDLIRCGARAGAQPPHRERRTHAMRSLLLFPPGPARAWYTNTHTQRAQPDCE